MSTTDYIDAMLFALIGNHELVKSWWTTPNKGFDMHCPCDVPETEVKSYLEFYCFK